jgi:poly(A) polymerase
VRERGGLAILSAERVRQEFLRLLAARRGPELVAAMFDYGILVQVLGAAPRPSLLSRLAAIEAALSAEADPVLRLAALAVETPEDAERLRQRMRLSNEEAAELARAAARAPDIGPAVPEAAAKIYLYRNGATAYREHLLLAWTRSGASPKSEAWLQRLALPDRWQPSRLPFGGADVMALGVPAGPRVGQVLRALEAWWIAGGFTADEAALRTRLEQLAAQP